MIIKYVLSITCVDFFVHMLLSSCLGKYSPWANGFPSYNKIPISHMPYLSSLKKLFMATLDFQKKNNWKVHATVS